MESPHTQTENDGGFSRKADGWIQDAELNLFDRTAGIVTAQNDSLDTRIRYSPFQIKVTTGFCSGVTRPELRWCEFFDNALHSAVVVNSGVTDQNVVKLGYPSGTKEWGDDRPARVESPEGTTSCVDEKDFRAGELHHRSVPVTDA